MPNLIDTRFLMNSLYATTNSSISDDESAFITQKGGSPVYGEIKPDSLATLLNDLKITKKDILYDLGSGTGKVVVQSYLEFPFKKVVGIELSQHRHQQAMRALDALKTQGRIEKNRTISFIQGDIIETPYTDATVIFTCSTCFSDELMTKLAQKFAQLKKGSRIISLKKIANPENYNLTLVREYRLPMSWPPSTPQGSPVYLYQRT